MQSQGTLPPKRDVARALLLRGSVFVHLDPRADGVDVPPWLSDQAQLVLQVGLDLPLPIPDLRVDEAGVYGTLSFSRSPYTCTVPWDAVFAVVGEDGRGLVWPESMPSEIAAEVEREAGERAPAPIGDPDAPGAGADEADGAGSHVEGPRGAKVVRLDDRRPRPAGASLARREQAEEPTPAEPESEAAPGAALTKLSEGSADGAAGPDQAGDEAAWGASAVGEDDGALEGETDEPPKPPPAPTVSRDDGGKSKRRRDGQQDSAAEPGQARKRRRRRGQDLPPYLKVVK